jgi:hypothetical protein
MENTYSQEKIYELQDSFVCYADILGFTEKTKESIKNGSGDQFLRKIKNALDQAYSRIKEYLEIYHYDENYHFKIFTDNIVISIPLQNFAQDKGEPELGRLIYIISEYQTYLACEGFFIRGGIAYGKQYMDDNIVLGEAIIEAHKLDSKGSPPRIELSENVKEIVDRQIAKYSNVKISPHYRDLLQDQDGKYFLNYLKEAFAIFPDGDIFFEVLTAHKNNIEENLKLFINKPYIRQKYEWLARYHNFICKEVANNYPLLEDPDQPPKYATASQSAQKTLEYLIDGDTISLSRLSLSNVR